MSKSIYDIFYEPSVLLLYFSRESKSEFISNMHSLGYSSTISKIIYSLRKVYHKGGYTTLSVSNVRADSIEQIVKKEETLIKLNREKGKHQSRATLRIGNGNKTKKNVLCSSNLQSTGEH